MNKKNKKTKREKRDWKQIPYHKLTLYSCVDVGSVSCVISRLAHKALCILGHMQTQWHEIGHFWFDPGPAVFYSWKKKSWQLCESLIGSHSIEHIIQMWCVNKLKQIIFFICFFLLLFCFFTLVWTISQHFLTFSD